MFRTDPHCHWCKVLTLFDCYGKPRVLLATIDHVKCKEQCKTWAEYIHPTNKVLACYGCNQRRNDEHRAQHDRGVNPPPALRAHNTEA